MRRPCISLDYSTFKNGQAVRFEDTCHETATEGELFYHAKEDYWFIFHNSEAYYGGTKPCGQTTSELSNGKFKYSWRIKNSRDTYERLTLFEFITSSLPVTRYEGTDGDPVIRNQAVDNFLLLNS